MTPGCMPWDSPHHHSSCGSVAKFITATVGHSDLAVTPRPAHPTVCDQKFHDSKCVLYFEGYILKCIDCEFSLQVLATHERWKTPALQPFSLQVQQQLLVDWLTSQIIADLDWAPPLQIDISGSHALRKMYIDVLSSRAIQGLAWVKLHMPADIYCISHAVGSKLTCRRGATNQWQGLAVAA